MAKSKAEWEAVRRDWIDGLSKKELVKKHSINPKTLANRITDWKKDVIVEKLPPVTIETTPRTLKETEANLTIMMNLDFKLQQKNRQLAIDLLIRMDKVLNSGELQKVDDYNRFAQTLLNIERIVAQTPHSQINIQNNNQMLENKSIEVTFV